MKIGILTFHRADNFGAVLQNYALQQAIFMIGMEPETIDYNCQSVERVYEIWTPLKRGGSLAQVIKTTMGNILNFPNAVISRRKFEDFRKKYLKISSKRYNANTISNAMYDVYIVGSDQIWNKKIIGIEDIPIYTLTFIKEHKATYGASSGGMDCLIDDIDSIAKIEMITVREQQLCDKLKKMGIDSKVVCDPVFLLKKDRWRALIKGVPRKKHRYVFLYYIDSGREQTAAIAKEIASHLGIKVHYPKKYDKTAIMDCYGINMFSDGPLDFVAEINQAAYVVSASFHGVAFAVLMEKEFIAVLHEKTGERVKSLLEYLGLDERIVVDKKDFERRSSSWKPIDYNKTKKKLNVFRTESMECLREMCRL